ncbi:MAG: cupin domain-containing protein [Pseudomonadales bacterium]
MKVLGNLTPDQFLSEHWQRKPLLVRAALKDYVSPLSADELAGLALEEEVESRLVSNGDATAPWPVRFGPFSEQDFARLPKTDWTLLVQAVDLWCPEVAELYAHFDFLPRWRTDDIMASYAAPGGSVGPHFDQYDVFLIQIAGHRRWQIGTVCDDKTPLVEGTELQIIDKFEAVDEWVLGPGDMLYLPPGVAHWGVAQDACMTFSLGFRSPLLSDMLSDLAVELSAQGLDQHYRDPVLTAAMGSDEIDPVFIAHAKQQLLALLDNEPLIADWLARFMTAPKYPDLVDASGEQRQASTMGRQYRNGEPTDQGQGEP